jgi:Serine/threonine protein kinase
MKIIEFYQDENQLYIVTEFYDGGELFDKIIQTHGFTEKQAATAMKQILSAINHCHKHNIVHRYIYSIPFDSSHRDIKPENILYESPKPDSLIKVIDFGTSEYFKPNESLNKATGTVSIVNFCDSSIGLLCGS